MPSDGGIKLQAGEEMRQAEALSRRIDAQKAWKETLDGTKATFGAKDLMGGMVNLYEPTAFDEDGKPKVVLPNEIKEVKIHVEPLIQKIKDAIANLLNVNGTVDWANAGQGGARADVSVRNQVLIKDTPVTWILATRNELNRLKDWVETNLPVLELNQSWSPDKDRPHVYTTPETERLHPAKVEVQRVTQDASPDGRVGKTYNYASMEVTVGKKKVRHLSGAVPISRKTGILENIRELIVALDEARSRANNIEVTKQTVGDGVAAFIFSGAVPQQPST